MMSTVANVQYKVLGNSKFTKVDSMWLAIPTELGSEYLFFSPLWENLYTVSWCRYNGCLTIAFRLAIPNAHFVCCMNKHSECRTLSRRTLRPTMMGPCLAFVALRLSHIRRLPKREHPTAGVHTQSCISNAIST